MNKSRLPQADTVDDHKAGEQTQRMVANLTPSYQLTSEHPASRGGIPILLHRPAGQAHDPNDVLEPFPSIGLTTAAAFVARHSKKLQGNELAAADTFLRQWPEGPQLSAPAPPP